MIAQLNWPSIRWWLGEILYWTGCFFAVLQLLVAAGSVGSYAAGLPGSRFEIIFVAFALAPIWFLIGYGARRVLSGNGVGRRHSEPPGKLRQDGVERRRNPSTAVAEKRLTRHRAQPAHRLIRGPTQGFPRSRISRHPHRG